MKIRIIQPTAARIEFAPGDELQVSTLNETTKRLVDCERIDGQRVAEIVNDSDEQFADEPSVGIEKAITGRGRGGHRAATLP